MKRAVNTSRRNRFRQAGQVATVALIVTSLLVVSAGVAYTVATVVVARIELQNAVDAGATAGAAVIADGLNLLAVTNGLLLAMGLGAFFSGGSTLRYVRSIQRWQDVIISSTPRGAMATAIATAMSQGADLSAPIPARKKGWPSLMVKRVHFLPVFFGKAFPLWVEDELRPTPAGRFGDRVVMLTAVKRVENLVGGTTYLTAKAIGAVSGRRVLSEAVFWPPPEPMYFPRLMADER